MSEAITDVMRFETQQMVRERIISRIKFNRHSIFVACDSREIARATMWGRKIVSEKEMQQIVNAEIDTIISLIEARSAAAQAEFAEANQ